MINIEESLYRTNGISLNEMAISEMSALKKAREIPAHFEFNNKYTPNEFSKIVLKYAKLVNNFYNKSETENDDYAFRSKKANNIIKGLFDELELDCISDLDSLDNKDAVIEHYRKYIDAIENTDYISKVGDSKAIHDGLRNLKMTLKSGKINESLSEESAEDIIMSLIYEYCDFDFEDREEGQKALELVDKLMNVVKSFN